MKKFSFIMMVNIESDGEDSSDALHRFMDRARDCGLRIRQQKNAVCLGEMKSVERIPEEPRISTESVGEKLAGEMKEWEQASVNDISAQLEKAEEKTEKPAWRDVP